MVTVNDLLQYNDIDLMDILKLLPAQLEQFKSSVYQSIQPTVNSVYRLRMTRMIYENNRIHHITFKHGVESLYIPIAFNQLLYTNTTNNTHINIISYILAEAAIHGRIVYIDYNNKLNVELIKQYISYILSNTNNPSSLDDALSQIQHIKIYNMVELIQLLYDKHFEFELLHTKFIMIDSIISYIHTVAQYNDKMELLCDIKARLIFISESFTVPIIDITCNDLINYMNTIGLAYAHSINTIYMLNNGMSILSQYSQAISLTHIFYHIIIYINRA